MSNVPWCFCEVVLSGVQDDGLAASEVADADHAPADLRQRASTLIAHRVDRATHRRRAVLPTRREFPMIARIQPAKHRAAQMPARHTRPLTDRRTHLLRATRIHDVKFREPALAAVLQQLENP